MSEPRHLIAYRALLTAISEWELQPGQPIPEIEFATRLGISRTPLREALRMLSDHGLVHTIPGRGSFVAGLTVADVREIYEMREALESYAARLAAIKGVDETLLDELEAEVRQGHGAIERGEVQQVFDAGVRLDRAIADAASNQRLSTALDILRVQAARIRRMAALSNDRLHAAVDEHLDLVAALRARDPDAVVGIVHRHIGGSADSKLGILAPGGNGTVP